MHRFPFILCYESQFLADSGEKTRAEHEARVRNCAARTGFDFQALQACQAGNVDCVLLSGMAGLPSR